MFKRLLYIFLFLFAGVAAFAQQYPVQGSLAIASPYPANLSDYANSSIQNVALNLTLTDMAMTNKRVRLKLFIQTQNATIAQSIDNISGEPLIMLDGGIPQRFTNNELAHYFRLENLQGINPDGYAKSLSEGIYTIGFEVYDYFTGNKLSGRISQTFWIIINDPPLLNTPTDKSKIADFTSGSGGNGGIIFNWTPRSTQVTNTEYEFTLCELWDATGDPYQQFMSAIPKYQTTVSNTTTLIYSLAQPTLVSGYTYAWRVRAKAKAGFEDIGLYRNDGYSNLFTFRYGDPCPPPQSLVLETKTSEQISATWQAPLTTGSGSGEAYKIAYRKYTIAGQWNWAESETSNLFLTISNLEPATEYEIKVGVPCNDGNSAAPLSPGRGAGGEVVFTPSQRATTLPAGQIAGIECGKEPVIDLSNQKLIENLKVGDVVMANDHPHTLTRVTGSSQGWSGESWSKESLLGGIKLKFRFSNIKVNTDKRLIDGYFESVYDDNLSNIINPGEVVNSMINDVTTLVDDINALTTKIDDFIAESENKPITNQEIDSMKTYTFALIDNAWQTADESTKQVLDSARNDYKDMFDCYSEQAEGTTTTPSQEHGGPRPEMGTQQNCAQYGVKAAKKMEQAKKNYGTKLTYSDPFPIPTLRTKSSNPVIGKFGCNRIEPNQSCSYSQYSALQLRINANRSHHGLDILAEVGTGLHSMYTGTVVDFVNTFVPRNLSISDHNGCDYMKNSFGNYVIMKYEIPQGVIGIDGKKYTTIYVKYCHLDVVESNLKKGITAKNAGEKIGTCGCSGNAGSLGEKEFHLHMEANTSNNFSRGVIRMINPRVLFQNGIINY